MKPLFVYHIDMDGTYLNRDTFLLQAESSGKSAFRRSFNAGKLAKTTQIDRLPVKSLKTRQRFFFWNFSNKKILYWNNRYTYAGLVYDAVTLKKSSRSKLLKNQEANLVGKWFTNNICNSSGTYLNPSERWNIS